MYKEAFLEELRKRLTGLPEEDIEERIAFYSELIDDRMEEGLTEEQAIAETGPIDQIVSQIIAETPLHKLVKASANSRKRMSGGQIALIAAGSPLWAALGVAVLAVLFALYLVLWGLVFALWVVFGSFVVSALGSIAGCVYQFIQGQPLQALMCLGAGLFLAGLSIFLFFGCLSVTKGMAKLSRRILVGIKSLFIRKENKS
jgi:uncharacterized membrane protein